MPRTRLDGLRGRPLALAAAAVQRADERAHAAVLTYRTYIPSPLETRDPKLHIRNAKNPQKPQSPHLDGLRGGALALAAAAVQRADERVHAAVLTLSPLSTLNT